MNGFQTLCFLITSLFLALNGATVGADNAPQTQQNILILKSNDNSYYQQTIHSMTHVFAENTHFISKNIATQPINIKAQRIITLGADAALFSRRHYPNTSKIHAFITRQQSLTLGLEQNEHHLLIEQKAEHYLQFSHMLLPQYKVGILLDDSQQHHQQALKSAHIIHVHDEKDIINATRKAIKASDLLLALPNKTIFNRHTLKGILLSTFQNNTPFISYSPAHVKAGAIAAIYASPTNIAQQIADLLMQKKPSTQRRIYAHYFTIKTNPRVARSLNVQLPDTAQLHQLLAQKRSHHEQ